MLDAQIWWKNDNANSTGEEIGILAATAGYQKIVYKLTHVDISILNKCHQNIIYGKINIRVPLPTSICP